MCARRILPEPNSSRPCTSNLLQKDNMPIVHLNQSLSAPVDICGVHMSLHTGMDIWLTFDLTAYVQHLLCDFEPEHCIGYDDWFCIHSVECCRGLIFIIAVLLAIELSDPFVHSDKYNRRLAVPIGCQDEVGNRGHWFSPQHMEITVRLRRLDIQLGLGPAPCQLYLQHGEGLFLQRKFIMLG